MTRALRNRHLQIWVVAAFLVPAGVIAGWLVIPNDQPFKVLQPTRVEMLPVKLGTINRIGFSAEFRTDEKNERRQLIWINRQALTVPTAAIYSMNPRSKIDFSKSRFVGRIEATGTYIFDLQNGDESNFVVYDFIHEKVIDTLNFQQ